MAVHHAVGISRQRNSGYRPSRVNITAEGLSIPDSSLSPTHLSIRRGRATTTHYTHHQVSLMVSCNTTLVPSLGLHVGPACEAGLSTGMRREHVPPQIRKKERKTIPAYCEREYCLAPLWPKVSRVPAHCDFFDYCTLYVLLLTYLLRVDGGWVSRRRLVIHRPRLSTFT